MRSLNLNLVKITLLACFFIGLLIPGALALQNLYTVPADSGASCWASGTGSFFDGTYFISLTRPETDVYTGLMFQGLNISQGDLINNATLRLYYDIEFEPGSVDATLYGYDQVTGATFFTTANQLINTPLTGSRVIMNLTGISSAGWLEYDVTAIVQELTSRPFWNISDNLGFIIQGAEGQEHRTIVSNILYPTRWPQLNVTWADTGLPANETQSYKGYTIFPDYDGISAIMIDRSDKTELAILNKITKAWEYFDLNSTNIENYRTGTDHGVYVDGKIYMLAQEGGLNLYSFDLETETLTKIALLDATNKRDYALIYYPPEDSLKAIYIYTSPGDMFAHTYFLGNSSLSSQVKIHDGGTGQGRGLDAHYNDYWEKIQVAWCGSDTGGTGIHLRYVDYNGSWLNKMEWTDYSPSYPLIEYQDQYTWIWATPFPTFQDGWRINSNGGTSWSTSFSYGGFNINEEYFDTFRYNGSVYFVYCDDGPDKLYARKFTASQTPEANPPDIFYTPAAGSFSDMINYNFNGSELIMSIFNLAEVKAFVGELEVINDYDLNGTAIQDWASVDGTGYTSSGFSVIPPPGGTPPDPDCLAQATTIEEVQACIDAALGPDPLDPDPPGWSDEGDPEYLTRPLVIRFFLFIGLALVIVPFIWLIYSKQWATFPAVIFLQLVGAALLIYMASI